MAATLVFTDLDMQNSSRVLNHPAPVGVSDLVRLSELNAAIQGIAWKDNVRAASTTNINLAAPGASIDAVTMAASDRFLVKNQTVLTENGVYIWNGAAVAATRSADADTFDKLENAFVPVDEGTVNAGTKWRQTQVNGVIGTNNVVFASDSSVAPPASEATAGVLAISTQVETDAGVLDTKAITPLKLATSIFAARAFSQTIGDNVLTSITVTHNLNTRNVKVAVQQAAGNFTDILCEVRKTTVNSVTLLFNTAPANASLVANISRG